MWGGEKVRRLGLSRRLKFACLAFLVVFSLLAFNQPHAEVRASDSLSMGNPSLPLFQNLSLVVVYANGTFVENAVWDAIAWHDVEYVGVRNQFGVGGFEREYGSVVWCPNGSDRLYEKPLWFGYIRFWAYTGGQWYQKYVTTNVSKTPHFFEIVSCSGNVSGTWQIGWNGTVEYAGYQFPVYVGLEASRDSPSMKIKTNVTCPVAVGNCAMEYQLYLNPYYADKAEKNVRFVRVQYVNGSSADYDVKQAFEFNGQISNMTRSFSFLNGDKTVEINTFDFGDVFAVAESRFARIESVVLPSGESTYVVKVGATYGALTAGQTFTVDPSFGYTTEGSDVAVIENHIYGSHFPINEDGTGQSITVRLKSGSALSVKVKCAIYKWSDLSLVAFTEERTVTLSTTAAWFTFNLTISPSLVNGTEYLLAAWSEYNIGDVLITGIFGSDSGWSVDRIYDGNFPDPLPSPNSTYLKCSIFCNYTAGPNNAPTIGEFTPSTATPHFNEIFNVSCTIQDLDGTTQLKNATLPLDDDLTLTWDSSTDTFGKSDPNNYANLGSASAKSAVNSTAYTLTWNLAILDTYPEGIVSVTDAAVYDINSVSGTGSQANLFTISTAGSGGSGGGGGGGYIPPETPTIPIPTIPTTTPTVPVETPFGFNIVTVGIVVIVSIVVIAGVGGQKISLGKSRSAWSDSRRKSQKSTAKWHKPEKKKTEWKKEKLWE